MTALQRFCVYVDWQAPRDDAALMQIGADAIPDDADSETCIYWDEKRPDVLVLSWNFTAPDAASAHRLASELVHQAVSPVIAGTLGTVQVFSLDEDD